MNKNLVICPTYNRPEQLAEMVASFYKNSVCSDLILKTEKESITKLINEVNFENYQFVSVTNDDFVYNSYGWDEALINAIERKGWGIAFGNDGGGNKHLPSTCVMSAGIPKALGWIQYPRFQHLCGDMVWQTIGKLLNRLYYVPHVSIEHKHFLYGKAKKEDYEYTNSREMYINDNSIFQEWLLNESADDVERVRKAMEVQGMP